MFGHVDGEGRSRDAQCPHDQIKLNLAPSQTSMWANEEGFAAPVCV